MIVIRPMDEDYIHSTCLHDGPVDTETWTPDWETGTTDLPSRPWSDETIAALTSKHGTPFCGGGAWGAGFMREMIRRYGTCAILAWDEGEVVGHLQFYPMTLARLIESSWGGNRDPSPILDCRFACESEEDEGTLWVQCVMTARPYVASASCAALPASTAATGPTVVVSESGRRHRTREEAGARKGLGLKLSRALIEWAEKRDWRKIVKVAHCDVDWFYGIQGGGGKGFWEKAGFRVNGSFYRRAWEFEGEDKAIVEAQMAEKGMSEEDIWTWYRMRYDL